MAHPLRTRLARFAQLFRYYQSSIINTAFGYGLFALLIWGGLNIFVAQITAHVIGTVFNYVTHSRHSFRSTEPAKLRFAMAYMVMYLMSVGLLALWMLVIASPYAAGLVSAVTASLINYFVLKRAVFRKRVTA